EFPDMILPERTEIGVLAQEIEKIIPEVVDTDEEGYKSVQYSHIVPVLIEAMKELKAENDLLKAENQSLRNEVDTHNDIFSKIDLEKLFREFAKEDVSMKK